MAVQDPSAAAPAAAPSGKGAGLDDIIELGGDAKNPFTSMVAGVSTALSKMTEMLPQEGVDPALVQKLDKINEDYKAVMAEISGGGAPSPDAAAPAEGGAPPPGQIDANAGPRGIPAR